MPRLKTGDFDQKEYIKEYNKKHIITRKATFNTANTEDMRMVNWIDERKESTSAYLKGLVRKDMEKDQ